MWNKEFFETNVVVVHSVLGMESVLGGLGINNFKLPTENYPYVIYQDQVKGISMSGIPKENIIKLKLDKEFSKNVVELMN